MYKGSGKNSKWIAVKLNIQFLQGSAATAFRWGGGFYINFSWNAVVKELLKLVDKWPSYCNNNISTLFMEHGVVSGDITFMRLFTGVPWRGNIKQEHHSQLSWLMFTEVYKINKYE